MPNQDEAFYRQHIAALLGKLSDRGWISAWGIHDKTGRYMLKWTPKGLERARWVKEIATDLHLGPEGMCALLTICELHADDP